MAKVKAGNIKKGTYIEFRNQPHYVVYTKFVSPGKGSAFTRTKLRNLKTDAIFDFSFKSHDTVEQLDIESVQMQFLYADADDAVFMNPQTYEQINVPLSVLGKDNLYYLTPDVKVYVVIYHDQPMGVNLPPKVKLKVTKSQEAIAGDRQTAGKKPVTVETGLTVQAPLFIKEGEVLIIDTETGEYVSRA